MPAVSSSIRIGDPVAVRSMIVAVVGQLGGALGELALGLDRLVHVRRGALDRHVVGVVPGQVVERGEHPERRREVVGVDAGLLLCHVEEVTARSAIPGHPGIPYVVGPCTA